MEKKEEYIESEILCYFLEKWCKVHYKNDIKWFYDWRLWVYKRNKSNFIRRWISDITVLRKWRYIAIEVKKPSEMKFFDQDIHSLKDQFAQACAKWLKSWSLKRYRHAIEQREFLDDVESEWGVAFFACSLDQVRARLHEWWVLELFEN